MSLCKTVFIFWLNSKFPNTLLGDAMFWWNLIFIEIKISWRSKIKLYLLINRLDGNTKSSTTYIMLVTYFLQNLENQRRLSRKPPDKGLTFPSCCPLPFLHQNRTLLKLTFVLPLSLCKKTGSKITIFPSLTNLVAWLTNEMWRYLQTYTEPTVFDTFLKNPRIKCESLDRW